MMSKWQVRLYLDSEDYIVLEEDDSYDVIFHMLEWFRVHNRFFNGEFCIVQDNR